MNISLLPRRRHLLAALFVLSGGLVSASVLAQDDTDEDVDSDAESPAELSGIHVTGSRISRTELEGAQPVVVITNEDMAVRGYVTVFEALNDLTQNNGFKYEGPEAQLFTPDVQTLNLRSFGVGSTLVLINGRRVTNYPAAYQSDTSVFNYGAVPAAAVERIEILATGASAIYGSDAVAGVVNIILREDLDESNLNVLYSMPTEASGSTGTTRAQIMTGKLFERGSITAALEYQKRDPILGKHLDNYDSNFDFPYGEGVRDRAVLDLNYWDDYWGLDRYQDPGEGTCEAIGNGTVRSFRPGAGWHCGYDGAGEVNFLNEREHVSAFVSGQFDVSDNVNLFADILYYSSESRSNSWGIYIFEDILDTDTIVTTPFGFDYFDWYLGQRAFTEEELGRSLDETYEDDALTVSVGARGYWRDTHEWELSFTHSGYEMSSSRPWWKAAEVIDVFLGDWNGVGFFGDNWWEGNGSVGLAHDAGLFSSADAALVNSAIGQQTYGNETESQLIQFTMNGDIMDMKYGPLSYAVVLEHEKQDFAFIPDDLIQQPPVAPFTAGSGWYNLTGYDGEGDRDRNALGVELRVPLHDTLTFNLAARVDDYDSVSSSIGTRTTPSASIEWRPLDNLLVRAGYTESFRAPDLNVVYTSTGFYTGRVDVVQCAQIWEFETGSLAGFDPSDCDTVTIFAHRTPATELDDFSEPLRDETGDSWWVGFSVEPFENFSLQVDYSEISLEDIVQLESLQDLFDDEYACWIGELTGQRCDYVANRIERETDPSTGFSYVADFNASPVNASLREVTSVDVVANYAFETRWGDFRLRADWTHTLDNIYKNRPGDPEIDLRNDPIQGGWDFRSIVTGTLAFSRRDFSAALTGIRRGSTTLWRPLSSANGYQRLLNGDYRVGPHITWNMTATYSFTDKIDARLRVVNLFDAEPPKDDSFLFYDYPWYNIYVYPGAGIGRQAAVEVNFRFE